MNMFACTLFNEQDKSSNLLSIMTHDLYWDTKSNKEYQLTFRLVGQLDFTSLTSVCTRHRAKM